MPAGGIIVALDTIMEDDMPTLNGYEYLMAQLRKKEPRVRLRYRYYDQKVVARDFRISTPPDLLDLNVKVGWATTAVDSLANRLKVRSVTDPRYKVETLFATNNPDIIFRSAIVSALIASCSFAYIYKDAAGAVRIQIIDAANATGTIDPVTYLLTEGVAVLDRGLNGEPVRTAYFEPGRTTIYTIGDRERVIDQQELDNSVAHPLLVPIIYRPDASRPFGHSRISRAGMNYIDEAARTLKRSEVSAEFYSFPQRWVTGLEQDFDQLDKWRASMSAMMQFEKDSNGDSPKLGQFTQQSMDPHVNQLRMFASMFAGETGLTLDDLGFVSDNPSSSEAIKASHETLRLMARAAQDDFRTAIINIVYTAMCLQDGVDYTRETFANLSVKWEPAFEPDMAAIGNIGDAILKINQAVPGTLDKNVVRDLTGLEVTA